MSENVCIGLFGTCGNSTWRSEYIPYLEAENINYFNPQKDGWCEEDAAIEARHLINDDVILFPVTAETYGSGSLAETGFSILQALKSTKHRAVVIFIDPTLDPNLKESNPVAAKESIRTRILTIEHLKNVNDPRVFLVNSMEDMYKVGIQLAKTAKMISDIRLGKIPELPKLEGSSFTI